MDKLDLLDQLQQDEVTVDLNKIKPAKKVKSTSSKRRNLIALAVVGVIATGYGAAQLPINWQAASDLVSTNKQQAKVERVVTQTQAERQTLASKNANDDTVSLNATGYIVATKQATVAANTTGRVEQVFVKEGQIIEQGQLLAKLDDRSLRLDVKRAESNLRLQQIQLQELEVEHQDMLRKLEREETLFAKKLISSARLDELTVSLRRSELAVARTREQIEGHKWQLKQQQHHLQDMEIRAPFAGIAVSISAQEGEIVSPLSAGSSHTRTGIATIVDMSTLQVEADISETYLGKIQLGQLVSLKVNSFPGEEFNGRVDTILPTADRQTATVKVRISLAEHYPGLLPEMAAQVAFMQNEDAALASNQRWVDSPAQP